MTFDDEEHRVKRILDTEPHSGQNAMHTNNAPYSDIVSDLPHTHPANTSADTKTDISSTIQNDTSHKTTPDTSENPSSLPHTDDVQKNDSIKNSEDSTKNETTPTIEDTREFPVYDGEVSENINQNFYKSDEEVFKRPADALKEEKQKVEEQESAMGVLDHLGELRRRLTRIVIFILLGFFAFYGVSELAYSYLAAPLTSQLPEGSKLIYTSPQGAFFTYLKVAFMLSILGTSPFTFYQIWAFIAPGLYKEEQNAIIPLAFFSAFFFLGGAAFCYFAVFPVAFKFFIGFTSDMVIPMISVEEYLSFALKLIIAFGLVFEMPLFSYFLAKLRILTPEGMRKQRKYAILTIFVIAAILTPPDVISQTLMALPMLLLYEISIYVAKVARGLNAKKETKKEAQETDNTKTDEPQNNTQADNIDTTNTNHMDKNDKSKENKNSHNDDISKLSDEELAARINSFR